MHFIWWSVAGIGLPICSTLPPISNIVRSTRNLIVRGIGGETFPVLASNPALESSHRELVKLGYFLSYIGLP